MYYLPGKNINKNNEDDIFGNGILDNKSTYFGREATYNKLLQIEPLFPINYTPVIGDLIIGRVSKIESNRWVIEMTNWTGYLQIFNVHYESLCDFKMRDFLQIGDWICAEILKITGSSVELHMRRDYLHRLDSSGIYKVPLFLMKECKNMFSKELVYFGANGIIYSRNDVGEYIEEKIKSKNRIEFEEIKKFYE